MSEKIRDEIDIQLDVIIRKFQEDEDLRPSEISKRLHEAANRFAPYRERTTTSLVHQRVAEDQRKPETDWLPCTDKNCPLCP